MAIDEMPMIPRAHRFLVTGIGIFLISIPFLLERSWVRWLRPRNPDVLIISIESLRWDHVGALGYERDTTPNVDRLVELGTVFRRTYAQASWTRPSVASTFTSTYASTHLTSLGFRAESGSSGLRKELSESFVTLAELFEGEGYRSYGWTANPQLSIELGFGQGFHREAA
jgi:hypothetical protein